MEIDDAARVAAARTGDRRAFAAIYDRYADQLYDFCWGVLRDRDEAADAVHDAFLIAWQRLEQLRDPSSLRAWLYAIARHEAMRRGKARARATPTEVMVDVAAPDPGPEDGAARTELVELVWSAAAGLDERDRVVLDLSVRQGLDTSEIAAVVGVKPAHASVLVNRMRERVERSLGALLVARLGRRDCPELQAILAGWDGTFTVRMRKRVGHHADECERCDRTRRGALNPVALLGASAGVAAPAALRERVLEDVQLVGAGRPWPAKHGGFPPPMTPAARPARVGAWAAAAMLGLVLAATVPVVTGPVDDAAVPEPSIQSPSPVVPGAASPSEAAGSPPPTPSGPADAPARLVIGSTDLDFGSLGTARTVSIANSGGTPMTWQASTTVAAIDITPDTGEVAGGDDVTMTVVFARAGLAEGDLEGVIAVQTTGGDGSIVVRARVEHDPMITSVFVAADEIVVAGGDACGDDTTTVTARASDEGVLTLELRWDGPDGSGARAMEPGRGDRFAATLGPFPSEGIVEVWVVATDARGNATTSAPQEVPVLSCDPPT